jgi:hypothetical protein
LTYDGAIRCTYELEEKLKPDTEPKINVHLEFENGDPVSENEIDIGQEAWQQKIPQSPLPYKWKLENYTPDILDIYWQRRCFATMFRSIGWVIPLKYASVRSNSEDAFFNIRFTDDLDVFGGREGVLAHAYLYHKSNPAKFNGLMEWNDNHFFTPFGDTLPAYLIDPDHFTQGETWSNGNVKTLATQPLLEIGMHELKHNHGYRHNLLEKTSLLYPFVKRGVQTIINGLEIENKIIPSSFQWTSSDLKRWEDGYGRRQLGLGWLNRFRARRVRARRVEHLPYYVAV